MQNLPRDCVVIINSYETCRDKEPFPSFRTTETFQGKSRVHQMTVKSTASKYWEYGGFFFIEADLTSRVKLVGVYKFRV